ncbi:MULTISPECIES: hypothetical protein [Aeromonas]|uniref:hypothetical protein n=1 Tax=Aeromonas TaxID=642 RepID=UPI002B058EA5|nr:hypothetical protein [Aeromonas jandaei]
MMHLTLKLNGVEHVDVYLDLCEIHIDSNVISLQMDKVKKAVLLKTQPCDEDNAYQFLSFDCVASNAILIKVKKDGAAIDALME